MVHIKRGLDIPLSGKPVNKAVVKSNPVKTVAVSAADYLGLKPTMLVQVGDKVKVGQPLFQCKKVEGVLYTSPAGGKVTAINRGERRVFQNIVIEIENNEEYVEFERFNEQQISKLSADAIRAHLQKTGMWPSFRTRPFSKAPQLNAVPHSIFVTAMDTAPLAPSAATIIGDGKDFACGVAVLSGLISGQIHVCHDKGDKLNLPQKANVKSHEFYGKHPAGNAGTHIHFIDPVFGKKEVWSIGYQEVIEIGRLFATGKRSPERTISIAGPGVKEPQLVKTRFGANINELVKGLLDTSKETRVISGSAIYGRKVEGIFHYLGHYHNTVTVLAEGRQREFLGWMLPGLSKFTATRAYLGGVAVPKSIAMDTNTNGGIRAMVPIGLYEKVLPIDTLATPLIRALLTEDLEAAEKLGALELDEEDLALCTYVDPGKTDYGPLLRKILTTIEAER